ncbi:unnamed protein product, partial [Phaeothamnion confervicola]
MGTPAPDLLTGARGGGCRTTGWSRRQARARCTASSTLRPGFSSSSASSSSSWAFCASTGGTEKRLRTPPQPPPPPRKGRGCEIRANKAGGSGAPKAGSGRPAAGTSAASAVFQSRIDRLQWRLVAMPPDRGRLGGCWSAAFSKS